MNMPRVRRRQAGSPVLPVPVVVLALAALSAIVVLALVGVPADTIIAVSGEARKLVNAVAAGRRHG